MNLITAVGFENLIFEMYLTLWPCEKSLFQHLTSLAQKSLFWAKGHCQINFSFLLLGGKRNRQMQFAKCICVNSFWIARGTAPPLRLWVPGQSTFTLELGDTGKSAQSLKTDHFFWPKHLLFKNWNLSLSFHLMVSL